MRKGFHLSFPRVPIGVALDIDGVLLRGATPLKGASDSLKLLQKHRIPHIFVTNGGGCSESSKAEQLSKKLDVEIHEGQILLSHTPLKRLAQNHQKSSVLVVGHENCANVVRRYGFPHVITPRDLKTAFPTIYPLKYGSHESLTLSESTSQALSLPISAAFVVDDPTDWGLDIQVLCDVLLGTSPLSSHPSIPNYTATPFQQIPLYASNFDLIYTAQYPHPRLTQGAFLRSFQRIFEEVSSHLISSLPSEQTPQLQLTLFGTVQDTTGKPFPVQYSFAKQMLINETLRLHPPTSPSLTPSLSPNPSSSSLPPSSSSPPLPSGMILIGVGDNLHSDILGANQAGEEWRSILVSTGVYRGDGREFLNPLSPPPPPSLPLTIVPDLFCTDVLEATHHILSLHSSLTSSSLTSLSTASSSSSFLPKRSFSPQTNLK